MTLHPGSVATGPVAPPRRPLDMRSAAARQPESPAP